MYLIVGLGNPEPEYSNTRHNMGFDVINNFSEKYEVKIQKNKFNGIYNITDWNGEKIILLKPQTYMNNSGECIIAFKNYFKIQNENIIIIYDDVDIEAENIRIREKGSANTHNGMKSVIEHLGTTIFPRIRVGIGTPDKDIADYVLEKIKLEDREKINYGIEKATSAIEDIIKNGTIHAMNKFN